MRLLHCNLGSHIIFVLIITALAYVPISTTAGGGIDGEVEKDQEQDQDKDKERDKEKEKEEYRGTEL